MKLPGGDRAVIPAGKLERYCLSSTHREGGPKARVFAAALGLTIDHVEDLRRALLKAAMDSDEVERLGPNGFGTLYRLRFVLHFRRRQAVIKSGWIVRDDGVPYLTTALVEKTR